MSTATHDTRDRLLDTAERLFAERGMDATSLRHITTEADANLAFAKLDVFRQEPLPEDHPFWRHPKIRLTPHNAGITNPDTAADQILENYRRAKAGEALNNVVDPERGY